MTFDIEADDMEQGRQRMRDLQAKITTASQRLGIGFIPGTVTGQPQGTPRREPDPLIPPDQDPETLFDEPVDGAIS